MTGDFCEISLALEVIGGKWKGPIIWLVRSGTRRFGELRRLLPELTPRTLTTQLREMERDGLLTRVHYPTIPPKVEYTATPMCLALADALDELKRWGRENFERIEDSRAAFARAASKQDIGA